jgi:hypothetical protein
VCAGEVYPGIQSKRSVIIGDILLFLLFVGKKIIKTQKKY